MTLDEAIQRELQKSQGADGFTAEHRQLAEWLIELKELRAAIDARRQNNDGPLRKVVKVEERTNRQPGESRYSVRLSCGHVFGKKLIRAGAEEKGVLKCRKCKDKLPPDEVP